MKKLIAVFLLLTFGNLNLAIAADYCDYLFSDNNNVAANNTSNVVIIPEGYNKTSVTKYTKQSENNYDSITSNTQIYIDDIKDTDECYSGSVKYAYQPVATTTQKPLEKDYQTNTKAKNSGTFSENHPILTGLGIGILIAGMVVGAVLLDTDDEDDCDECRHYNEHHRHHHHSHSNHVCKH